MVQTLFLTSLGCIEQAQPTNIWFLTGAENVFASRKEDEVCTRRPFGCRIAYHIDEPTLEGKVAKELGKYLRRYVVDVILPVSGDRLANSETRIDLETVD